MKNCNDCRHATWDRTKNGRLHPSGGGSCRYPYKIPQLPSSMYWLSFNKPTPLGGWINRREELKDHCPYYEAMELK